MAEWLWFPLFLMLIVIGVVAKQLYEVFWVRRCPTCGTHGAKELKGFTRKTSGTERIVHDENGGAYEKADFMVVYQCQNCRHRWEKRRTREHPI